MRETLEDILSYAKKDNRHAIIKITERALKEMEVSLSVKHDFKASFGRVIREHRVNRNIPQQKLAKMVDVSRETMRLIENGVRSCDLELAYKISQVLNFSFFEFLEQRKFPVAVDEYIVSFMDSVIDTATVEGMKLKAPWVAVRPDSKLQDMNWDDTHVRELTSYVCSHIQVSMKERFGNRDSYQESKLIDKNNEIAVLKAEIQMLKKELRNERGSES